MLLAALAGSLAAAPTSASADISVEAAQEDMFIPTSSSGSATARCSANQRVVLEAEAEPSRLKAMAFIGTPSAVELDRVAAGIATTCSR